MLAGSHLLYVFSRRSVFGLEPGRRYYSTFLNQVACSLSQFLCRRWERLRLVLEDRVLLGQGLGRHLRGHLRAWEHQTGRVKLWLHLTESKAAHQLSSVYL